MNEDDDEADDEDDERLEALTIGPSISALPLPPLAAPSSSSGS